MEDIIIKDVPGYEEYFSVSSCGKVWSKRSNKFLSLSLTNGYLGFTTRLGGRSSKSIRLRAHRLVAEAFIPNPENKPQVNHINGIKTDNRVENLEWVTASENIQHAWDTGLMPDISGEKGSLSKLTYEIVEEIRARYKPRCRLNGGRALAREFGVTHSTIQALLNNKTWKI